MGLFDIFKGKSENSNNNYEKETRSDNVFGIICRLGKASEWYTDNLKLNLFENEYNIPIALETTMENSMITDEQYVAGKNFIENKAKYQKLITESIMNFFSTNSSEKIFNSITIESVHISRTGKVCIMMECSEDFDETLMLNLSSDIIFDDSFGIEIYPEIRVLPNEKELIAVAYDD